MLRAMRQGGFIKALMGVVVVLIILAFALDFRSGRSSLDVACVVEVEGACVPPKDFQSSFLIGSLGRPDLRDDTDRQAEFRKQIIEGLIERELLREAAKDYGIAVDEEALFKEIIAGSVRFSLPAEQALRDPMVRLLSFKDNNSEKVEPEIYKRRVLNYTGLSTKDFERKQKAELVAARMRDLIMAQTRASVEEAFEQYQREQSKATARVARADTTWFARFASDSRDAAAQAYLDENRESVETQWKELKAKWQAGCPLVSEIRIDITGSEADAEQAIKEARELLTEKERFDLLARDLSDAKSAVIGGETGCLHEGYGPAYKTLLEAAAKLKVGELSQPIKSDRSFHLLKLEGKLEESEIDTRGQLLLAKTASVRDQGDKQAAAFAKRVIERVGGEVSLDDAVSQLIEEQIFVEGLNADLAKRKRELALEADDRLRVDVTSPFTRMGNPLPTAQGGASGAELAFGLETPGDVHPEPVKTFGGYAVLQLKEKTLATREDFDENKVELIGQLKRLKGAQQLAAYIARLRANAGDAINVNTSYFGQAKKDEDPTQDG